jgi:hypothetical protein
LVDELIAKLEALAPGESVALSPDQFRCTFAHFEPEEAKHAAAAALATANRCEIQTLPGPEAQLVFTKLTYYSERPRPPVANDRKSGPGTDGAAE